MAKTMKKTIIGLTEKIKIIGNKKTKRLKARIDTGATKGSVDISVVKELGLGPVIGKKKVKSAHGITFRPLMRVKIVLANKKLSGKFTIAERSHMRYKVLIGQDILKKGFLIDPTRK